MNSTIAKIVSGGLESAEPPLSPQPQDVESIAVLTTKVQAGGAPGLGRNARPHPHPLPLGRGRVFGSVIRSAGASGWRIIVMGNGPGTARPQVARGEFSGVVARANCRPRRARVGAGCPLWPRREIAGFPESWRDFVLHDVDGEWLMQDECPEIHWGKAEGSRLNAKVWDHEDGMSLACGMGKETTAGQRGNLDLDLNHDLDPSGLSVCGKRPEWCHPSGVVISLLWLPGVSRGDTPGYSNGILSGCAQAKTWESRCDFVPQDADDELVMPHNLPEFSSPSFCRPFFCPQLVLPLYARAGVGPKCGLRPTGKSATRQVWKPAVRLAEHRRNATSFYKTLMGNG